MIVAVGSPASIHPSPRAEWNLWVDARTDNLDWSLPPSRYLAMHVAGAESQSSRDAGWLRPSAARSAHSRSLHQITATNGLEWPQPHDGRYGPVPGTYIGQIRRVGRSRRSRAHGWASLASHRRASANQSEGLADSTADDDSPTMSPLWPHPCHGICNVYVGRQMLNQAGPRWASGWSARHSTPRSTKARSIRYPPPGRWGEPIRRWHGRRDPSVQ